MEMPEGWKRMSEQVSIVEKHIWHREEWMEEFKEFDKFKEPHPNRTALDLLKEMAEALEEMIEACDKGYARSMIPMKQILEKFRNWK